MMTFQLNKLHTNVNLMPAVWVNPLLPKHMNPRKLNVAKANQTLYLHSNHTGIDEPITT